MSIIISNCINKKIELKKHLNNFGLVFFNDKYNYDQWSKERISSLNINKKDKNKYLRYLKINNLKKNYNLDINFYNLVAKYLDLTVILHSMKSEDILVSGCSVGESLLDNTDILDLGCNAGYLASFYSKLFYKSKITGYDISYNSIKLAKESYTSKSFKNLYFTNDYSFIQNKKFDYVIDTQCLCSLSLLELDKLSIKVFNLLKKFGKLVSISSLSNEKEAHNFINIFEKNNLYVESITEVLVNSIYGLKAYTKIIITKHKKNHIVEIENYYKKLRKKISLLKVFDAF